MKKIFNPWRGHPRYNCFGCAPGNPIGLHLEFWEDGDDIVTRWRPQQHYQGWIDTMHGGILSTLIDETCGWVVTTKKHTNGFTVEMNVRFRKAVSTHDPELTVRAHITEQRRNLLLMHATIANSAGETCVEGDVTYYMMSTEKAKEIGFESFGD